MDRKAQLETLLNEAWREHRDEVAARVNAMHEALEGLRQGSMSETARAEANSAAHKLAGVLGTFGLKEASRAALEIEFTLAPGAEISAEKIAKFERCLAVVDEGLVKRDAQSAQV